MRSATRILLAFLRLHDYNVLFRAIPCVWKIHAVKLKNKLRTTVTKELKIDISTLVLIMF